MKLGPVNTAHLEPPFSYLTEERKQTPPQGDLNRLLLQITVASPLWSRFICNAKVAGGHRITLEHTSLKGRWYLRSMFYLPAGYSASMYEISSSTFITPRKEKRSLEVTLSWLDACNN